MWTILFIALGWLLAGVAVAVALHLIRRDDAAPLPPAPPAFEFEHWQFEPLTTDGTGVGGALATTGALAAVLRKGGPTPAEVLSNLQKQFGGEYTILRSPTEVRCLFTLPSGDRVTGVGESTRAAVVHLARRLGVSHA
jgi:hypothetical protein